jgi:hypothetical protein
MNLLLLLLLLPLPPPPLLLLQLLILILLCQVNKQAFIVDYYLDFILDYLTTLGKVLYFSCEEVFTVIKYVLQLYFKR